MIDKICLFLECAWILTKGIVAAVIVAIITFHLGTHACILLIKSEILIPLCMPVIAYSIAAPLSVLSITWEKMMEEVK